MKLVNVGYANIYASPSFQSGITTQAILGETLDVLDQREDWFYVRQWDEYEGWIYGFYVTDIPDEWEPNFHFLGQQTVVREHPDSTSRGIRQITTGSALPGVQRDEHLWKVTLPDGVTGYVVTEESVRFESDFPDNVLRTAQQFLGTTYFWGGKTPLGFDCSGFVQTVFRINDILLKRDAYMQAEQGKRLTSRGELSAGDLVFFREREKVSHVGIALDGEQYIHCSGFVRINSFNPDASNYRKHLDNIYVAANRIVE